MNSRPSLLLSIRQCVARVDRALLAALLLAMVFSLHGIQWGRVECWNRDAMALRELKDKGRPQNYQKPPFHTFLTHIVIKAPIDAAERIGQTLTGRPQSYNYAKLLGARLLTMALFLGTIVLGFEISRAFFGLFAARVTALVLATSAGFIGFEHFLTCDSPLLFWMMLALYFAMRVNRDGAMWDYVLAGFMTGVATNTKYNGLAMGMALVAAHVFSGRNRTWKERLFAPALIAGVLTIPVAIVITNPFMITDWHRFSTDFKYVNTVTPRYSGQAEGLGYWKFFASYAEVLGLPGAIAIGVGVLFSAVKLLRKMGDKAEVAGFLVIFCVTALYVLKMGSFPRMETRFALPSVPFAILMAGPFWKTLERWRAPFFAVAIPVLLYNCVCSFYVGTRFNDDPRMGALTWMIGNVKQGNRIESSGASPRWKKLPEIDAVDIFIGRKTQAKLPEQETVDFRMPHLNGRAELFKKTFQDDPWMVEQADRNGVYDETVFSRECLLARNPDFISVYSSDTVAPSVNAQQYYADLLAERFPYKIAYQAESPAIPSWVYPRHIDFLDGWIVLLNRKP